MVRHRETTWHNRFQSETLITISPRSQSARPDMSQNADGGQGCRPPAAAAAPGPRFRYCAGFAGAGGVAGAAAFFAFTFFGGGVVSTSEVRGQSCPRTLMELNLSKLPSALDSKPSFSAKGRSKQLLNRVALYHLRFWP